MKYIIFSLLIMYLIFFLVLKRRNFDITQNEVEPVENEKFIELADEISKLKEQISNINREIVLIHNNNIQKPVHMSISEFEEDEYAEQDLLEDVKKGVYIQ